MFEVKKTIWFLCVCFGSQIWAQPGFYKGDGSCQNPYIISDSIFSIQFNDKARDKVWFSFISPQREIYLDIKDGTDKPCNYLIFHKTNDTICTDIAAKKLIPERNKVCDKSIVYDASTTLSYENIKRGMCKCDYCCASPAIFYAIPDETYIIVIYNPQNNINIKLKTEKPAAVFFVEVQKDEKSNKKKIDKSTRIKDIKVGETLALENIYFEGGTPDILPVSYEALEGLHAFMVNNPSVKIEIHGHVNGPNEPPDINYSNNLGYRRARAVYDYLVNRNIDKNRMDYKGFGNTQMVYPNAVHEVQMAKNRRVEIQIISK